MTIIRFYLAVRRLLICGDSFELLMLLCLPSFLINCEIFEKTNVVLNICLAAKRWISWVQMGIIFEKGGVLEYDDELLYRTVVVKSLAKRLNHPMIPCDDISNMNYARATI